MPGGAAGELASLLSISAARFAVSFTSTSPCSLTIWPPAPAISALIHTTRPSYWALWTSTAVPLSTASSIISSQVKSSGGASTRSLRYQSSCVLLVCGIAQILPW